MKQGYAPIPSHDIEGQQRTVTDHETPVADAAREVAQSAKDHARDIGGEVREHGRNLAGQVGHRLSGEARSQNDRLASGLHKLADDLNQMGDGTSSVAATVIQRISGGSRQAATYLEQHGPEGLLRDVQEFARRRPAAFLLGAVAAGFVAGRLGKGLLSSPEPSSVPAGRSKMTGVAMTPAGRMVPNATGVVPVPSDSSAAAPMGTAPGSGVRS